MRLPAPLPLFATCMKFGRYLTLALAAVVGVIGSLILLCIPFFFLLSGKFPPDLGPLKLLLLGLAILATGVLLLTFANLYKLLHEFAVSLAQQSLQSKEGLALL